MLLLWRGKLFKSKAMLWALMLAFPFTYIANIAGWTVAETGRQPWVVYGLMRTKDAVTPSLTGSDVLMSLTVYVIAYIVISNFFLNVIFPKVMGDAVKLPPILVIIALIAGFSWGGILGMFVAVPVAATLRILFDHIYPRLYERPA